MDGGPGPNITVALGMFEDSQEELKSVAGHRAV